MRAPCVCGVAAVVAAAGLAAVREPKGEAKPDKELAALVEALDTTDHVRFEKAYTALWKGVNEGNLKQLLKAGEDKRPRVRMGVILGLVPFGKKPPKDIEPIVNFLLFRLKDADPAVRWYAASMCHWHVGKSSRLVAGLIKALKDNEVPKAPGVITPSPATAAASALRSAGKLGRPAYRPLIRLAEEGTEQQRYAAFSTIQFYAARDKPYQPLLVGFLINQLETARPVQYRQYAASALGDLKEFDRTTVPILRKAFQDAGREKDERAASYFRGTIIGALEKYGAAGTVALPDLLAVLKDAKSNAYVRKRIIDYIVSLKQEGSRYVPVLQRIADDSNEENSVRREAIRAVKALPPPPKPDPPAP